MAYQRSSNGPVAGILAVVVFLGLIGTAVYVAVLSNKKQVADEAQAADAAQDKADQDSYEPFKDYQLENPYDDEGKSSGSSRPFGSLEAPPDLLETGVWERAVTLAQEGYELTLKADRASKSGDKEIFRRLGKEAQRAFDKAFTMTAEWEEQIVQRYGEQAASVREVRRTRNKWIDRVRYFHKATPGN